MRKGPIQVPNEAFDRTIEYLEGSPGSSSLKFKMHAYIGFRNLLSRLNPAYHFDSIGEFLGYEHNLQSKNVITLSHLTATDVENKSGLVKIYVSDGTGTALLLYPHKPEKIDSYEMPPDSMNNPIHGTREGDTIELFESLYTNLFSPTYKKHGTLLLSNFWCIKNDDHYKRMKETREASEGVVHDVKVRFAKQGIYLPERGEQQK